MAIGSSEQKVSILNIDNLTINQTIHLPSRLTSLCYSPSGQSLLCGFDRELAVWDLLNQKFILTVLTLCKGPAEAIFSADGKFLVSSKKNSIIFWRSFDGLEDFRFEGHKTDVMSFAASGNGKVFVSGSEEGSIIIWNFEDKRLEFQINAHENKIKSVEVSSNGKYFASISENLLKVWNIDGKFEEFSFKDASQVESVKFSPDNKTLATTSNNAFIRIFDVEEKRLKNFYSDYMQDCPWIVFSPDKKELIICFSYGLISKWNLAQKMKQASYYQNLDYDQDFIIRSDGHQYIGLASPSQGLKIFNIKEKKIEFKLPEKKVKYDFIKVSENGLLLLTIEKQCLIIWDLKTNSKVFDADCVFGNLEKFPISKDFSLIVVPESLTSLSVWKTEKNIKMFDVEREDIKYSAVSFSHNSDFLAFGFEDGLVVVWQIDRLCEIFSLKSDSHKVLNLLFTEDLKFFISATAYCAYVWDMNERVLEFKIVFESSIKYKAGIIGAYLVLITYSIIFWNLYEKYQEFIVYSPENYNELIFHENYLIAPYQYHLDYWKFPQFLEIETIDEYKRFIPLNFSSDKKFAVNGYEKMLQLWLVDEQKEVLSFKAHKNWIRTVRFSHDSRFIASGADDGLVKIWDLNGKLIQCFEGHRSWVLTVAYSRDGKYLVSGSNDRVVLLWKVGISEKLKDFRLNEIIYSSCFSNSGKFIAVETISEIVRILRV